MALPHRMLRPLFALATGLLLAFYAFERATDPELRAQRAREEAMVLAARQILRERLAAGPGFEIVDPLAPRRAIGKAYIYPAGAGFDVSGHYRRGPGDAWHPFLVRLDRDGGLVELSVRDPALRERAAADPQLVVRP